MYLLLIFMYMTNQSVENISVPLRNIIHSLNWLKEDLKSFCTFACINLNDWILWDHSFVLYTFTIMVEKAKITEKNMYKFISKHKAIITQTSYRPTNDYPTFHSNPRSRCAPKAEKGHDAFSKGNTMKETLCRKIRMRTLFSHIIKYTLYSRLHLRMGR